MKAIIITFKGEIKDETRLAEVLANNIQGLTNSESVDITLLNDREVAKVTLKETIAINCAQNPELNAIKDFCTKIVKEIGPIPLQPREIVNQKICKFLVRENREVIASSLTIISKIDSTAEYAKHREILESFKLSHLPSLLRDINPIFKFF